jgi:hypothetical protein
MTHDSLAVRSGICPRCGRSVNLKPLAQCDPRDHYAYVESTGQACGERSPHREDGSVACNRGLRHRGDHICYDFKGVEQDRWPRRNGLSE